MYVEALEGVLVATVVEVEVEAQKYTLEEGKNFFFSFQSVFLKKYTLSLFYCYM